MTHSHPQLTPERIFGEPDLNGPDTRSAELSPDGSRVTYLRPSEADPSILDLWIGPADGKLPDHKLVDATALTSRNLTDAEISRRERQRVQESGIVDYKWDEKGERILVPVAGDLFFVSSHSSEIHRRLSLDDGFDITDARLSPAGKWLSFVSEGTLFVAPALEGQPFTLSPKANGAIRYATAEFVAQEEFARDTGYWWNPNESSIAYTRIDEHAVDLVERLEIGASGTTLISQRFPRAGRANAIVDLFVQKISGGAPVRVNLGPDTDVYLLRVTWSADGKTLYAQRQTRDQRTIDLLAVDPDTGDSRVVLTERGDPWTNPNLDFVSLKDGTFFWVSERTGYAQLYHYNPDGTLIRTVTKGSAPLLSRDRVRGIAGVNEDKGYVYVMTSLNSPLERHLYEVDYRNGSTLRKVTEGEGLWTIRMNAPASAFLGRFSAFDTPPHTALYASTGKRLRWLTENRLDETHPYFPYARELPKPTFGNLTAEDGQALHYVLLKPTGYVEGRRYPAIVQVYGGPGRQHVTKAWRALSERLFLDAGFVLFQLDNRGAFNRGLAFEAPISRKLGGPEVRDQLTGLRFLETLPFVDSERIGVMGWSYGGFMTLRMMTEPDSTFAAGAAGAAPADWHLYDTHYTEHYLGHPQDEADAYAAASIQPRLKNLKGRLLLMHGMADDNVLFENATRIMSTLQDNGIPFDLMLYPGMRHDITDRRKRVHQYRTYLEFFERTLGSPR
jgi:dipeptidyl-peptidase-4